MSRLLLVTAGLVALSCAGRQPADAAPAPAQPAAKLGPSAPGPGESVIELDLNHDGKPDVWKFVRSGPDGKEVVIRKEKDLNADGKIDTWEIYGPDGAIAKTVYDLDFDGKPDVTLFFEKEQLVRKEYAFGFDGVPHSWSFYEKGKLVRKERDANGDGKVDYWEYWENGEIDRIGVDLDGDGQVDKWESRRTAEAAPADAAAPAQK
jgi:hypothetical protein